MLKEIIEYLEGIPATIVSGIFLLPGIIIHLAEEFGKEIAFFDFLPFDPVWVTVIISGLPIIYSAVRKLVFNKGISKISSSLLMSIAIIAAISIGDLFAAGEVAFIMAIGEILEDKTTDRAKKGLKKLISLSPEKGRLIKDGKEEMIDADKIKVGDILRILPGERVPVDGKIISGETSIDQSVMTGESLPAEKGIGDSVYCGTVNCFGAVDIEASKVGEDSSLQKLIRMVKEAQKKKAPMQRTADKWASLLVPAALILALIAGLVKQDIVVAVTVLVVFCPCALVLATPTAIMAAIGQATKHGVVIKSGEALEKLSKVDTVAFDKTGTLTKGCLEVSDIISLNDEVSEESLLRLTASAESKSEHPLGKAIVNKARKENIALSEASAFTMTAGRGIFAAVEDKSLYCGSEKYLNENGIILSKKASESLEHFRNQGKATVITADKSGIIGIIALSDTVKSGARAMLQNLKQTGAKTLLLTGDNIKAAEYFAEKTGIEEIRADLLPEEKVQCITALQEKGSKVCMIGDGVNDAPALKSAEVGVAMGTMGSDIAVEAADIALMGDDISAVPYLKKLSVSTVKTIKVSISMSLAINFLAIILSFLEVLTPTTGALVHNAGSLFVILFAALLYDRKFDK